MPIYSVVTVHMHSGETMPMLLDSTTGLGVFEPTAYALHLRSRNLAANTIGQALRSVQLLYQILEANQIDLLKRIKGNTLLTLGEVDALVEQCKLKKHELNEVNSEPLEGNVSRMDKYPHEFLKGWTGTLVVDAYAGYDATMSLEGRKTANCLAHARRKFDELVKANASTVATQAIGRIAWLYRIEADARDLSCEQRLQVRQERSKPLWEEMHAWLRLERTRA
ncbi:MAG: transposase [Burkholderiales bacterium]|nr:transposase [Burkholderiales bacterium]